MCSTPKIPTPPAPPPPPPPPPPPTKTATVAKTPEVRKRQTGKSKKNTTGSLTIQRKSTMNTGSGGSGANISY